MHGSPNLAAEQSYSTDMAVPGQLAYMRESTDGHV